MTFSNPMNQAPSKGLLVIIPAYAERENLGKLVADIWEAFLPAHLLIVNDESGDGTPDWVRAHPEYGQKLFLMERPDKQGLGTAYIEGFRWGLAQGYGQMMEMDGDHSHDPRAIPHFLAALAQGAEVVLGSRYLGGVRILNWPIERLLLSLGASYYVRFLTGMPFTDPTGGFKCFRYEALKALDLGEIRSNGYAFQIETTFYAWRLGLHIVEIPIIFEDRHVGSSKMSGGIAREAVFQVLRLAWKRWTGTARKQK